jgi:hypothetical protein
MNTRQICEWMSAFAVRDTLRLLDAFSFFFSIFSHHAGAFSKPQMTGPLPEEKL